MVGFGGATWYVFGTNGFGRGGTGVVGGSCVGDWDLRGSGIHFYGAALAAGAGHGYRGRPPGISSPGLEY